MVGYSDDALPYVGEAPARPGLWVAGGYSGHGNVPGFLSGRLIADGITGRPATGSRCSLPTAERPRRPGQRVLS